MEPIKFEDNIREKLQDREIIPSKDIWEKLAKQLDSNPQKSTNKSIWLAFAAVFIGILIVTSLIFKDEVVPTQIMPELVEETTQNNVVIPDKNNTSIGSKKEEPSNEEISELITEKTLKNNQTTNKKELAVTQEKFEPSKNNKSIKELVTATDIDTSEKNLLLEDNEEEIFINSKVAEVVAQLQDLQKNDATVSAKEIDALLLKAQREIHSQDLVNNKNIKVDAKTLLNVVESELETSFRDKVFEALGDGYEKVRTAVAERNN